jgi:predicted RNase H-like HicB family nuclease
MTTYIALIHKDDSSDYGVSFPDLPGCVSAGSSIDEAVANAKEALSLHIEGMLEDGEEIPTPTDADEIDRENSLLIAAIDVPDNLKVERVNITVPAITLARIDSFAQQRGMTRSALLVEGVQRWVAEEHAALNRPQRRRLMASAAAAAPDPRLARVNLAPSNLSVRSDHLAPPAQRADYSKKVNDTTEAALSAIQEALNIREDEEQVKESLRRKDEAEKFEIDREKFEIYQIFEAINKYLDYVKEQTAPTEREEDQEKAGETALQTSDRMIDFTIEAVGALLERYKQVLKQNAKKRAAKQRAAG